MPKLSKVRLFLIKLKNWEYWPFSVLYFPVFFYFGWLALKARSVFFFTASNPSIDFGGMFGEKKSDIFDLIPERFIPVTRLVKKGDINQAKTDARHIGYPLIAKPDVGERGIWVSKIDSEEQLTKYAADCPVNFLLQELVDFPVEIGVFFVKYPGEDGHITSIVRKNFLTVIGNGKSTVLQLLNETPRAVLTADLSSDYLKKEGGKVLSEGESLLIEPIGNHCRGTGFLNDEEEIDDELNMVFNQIAEEIPDFYFGRFDIRCASFKDLRQLKNFKILELNGAGSEPGHIYQPGYSLIRAYKDILWHLRVLSDISIRNHKRGVPYWSFQRGYERWKHHKNHNRLLYNS